MDDLLGLLRSTFSVQVLP